MLSPFFGSLNVPIKFRAVAAISFTFVLFPVVGSATFVEFPSTIIMYLAMILEELFIGWLIGFVSFVSFSAVNLAGKVMDMQVGFAIVNVMDPTSGQQIPLIGSFLYNLAIMVFLITNGHHMVIAALAESFRVIPLMGMQWSESLIDLMIDVTAGIFTTGMKIAMPVTFAIKCWTWYPCKNYAANEYFRCRYSNAHNDRYIYAFLCGTLLRFVSGCGF